MKRRIEFAYDLDTFRGDLFGGITSTVVALPVSPAFGVASGLGAAAGLYGAIAVGAACGASSPRCSAAHGRRYPVRRLPWPWPWR